jgi:hypothetical protein
VGRIIGILGSLASGLVLAGVGILLNAWVLIYSGIAVFVLMGALWLYALARPIRVPVEVAVPVAPPMPEPAPDDIKGRAIYALAMAREAAALAAKNRSDERCQRAYNEVEAALLSIKREFGFGPLRLTGKGRVPYTSLLEVIVVYIDRILPLLREDHVQEARTKAMSFGWRWRYPEDGTDAELKAAR